uniref:Uncharacterized protein n=1 Tax=Myotis myotis TaxID=51298 RepID=A0A7J7UPE9_MYOMY|nr:hypothetical protein mMyoMyo1_008541 [Myotis myotis]
MGRCGECSVRGPLLLLPAPRPQCWTCSGFQTRAVPGSWLPRGAFQGVAALPQGHIPGPRSAASPAGPSPAPYSGQCGGHVPSGSSGAALLRAGAQASGLVVCVPCACVCVFSTCAVNKTCLPPRRSSSRSPSGLLIQEGGRCHSCQLPVGTGSSPMARAAGGELAACGKGGCTCALWAVGWVLGRL